MNTPDVSKRGVYYNLEISPYRYEAPYGEIFKFSSQKKLDMYTCEVNEFFRKFNKMIAIYAPLLGDEWLHVTIAMVEVEIYKKLYGRIEV